MPQPRITEQILFSEPPSALCRLYWKSIVYVLSPIPYMSGIILLLPLSRLFLQSPLLHFEITTLKKALDYFPKPFSMNISYFILFTNYFTSARVSLAIANSSLVGISITLTLESRVEITRFSPLTLFASSSSSTPR